MPAPAPQLPCPFCHGREFHVVENLFLEISDYGRAFDAVTCTRCGHTAFFTRSAISSLSGTTVRVPEPTELTTTRPYR